MTTWADKSRHKITELLHRNAGITRLRNNHQFLNIAQIPKFAYAIDKSYVDTRGKNREGNKLLSPQNMKKMQIPFGGAFLLSF